MYVLLYGELYENTARINPERYVNLSEPHVYRVIKYLLGTVFRVGNEKRDWREGQGFVFDDSFEHEAWNEGDSMRIVFLMRFFHPALTELEIEGLGALHERIRALVGESTAVQRELLCSLRSSGGR